MKVLALLQYAMKFCLEEQQQEVSTCSLEQYRVKQKVLYALHSIYIQVVEFWFVFCFPDGDDYTYTYASDSFDDGDSSDCNSVPILSDSIDEEEECFTVSLSTTSSYSGLTINPRIATVCIIDDDRECTILC